MRWKVLITAPYMQPEIERFRVIFTERNIELIIPPVTERLDEAELLNWVGDIDGVICGDDRFTERVLRSAPKLKVVAKWGTGIDSIDQQACRQLGIAVRNTPNAFSEPVADSVLGYMLCFARGLLTMNSAMHRGEWHKAPALALHECTLGIIGVGNVGKAVVRRAAAFGMRILGNDIVDIPADFLSNTGVTMLDKAELLRQADFVSLNCNLNPTSYHIISHAELELMKPSAVLINTARGPLIDEPALVKALQDRQIAGAALDVFENEPLPADSPLRGMAQVLLAPHNSNSSIAAREHVHHNTIRCLLEELEKHQ
jgi:D-3-phosphoglycerate dehydrogenase